MEGLKVCVVKGDSGRHTLECEEGEVVGQVYGIDTAHRVAACINLCSKLPTNVLMSISSLDTSALEGEVAKRHDRMLAALEQISVAAFESAQGASDSDISQLKSDLIRRMRRLALDGIQGAKPFGLPASFADILPTEVAQAVCLNDDDVVDASWLIAVEPVAWNGEGLPTVDTVCELRMKQGLGVWGKAEIKYISQDVCVWVWVAADGETLMPRERGADVVNMEFRPIRTAEQIAAEQAREKAKMLIGQILIDNRGNSNEYHVAGLLYDAGVRLVEGGAK